MHVACLVAAAESFLSENLMTTSSERHVYGSLSMRYSFKKRAIQVEYFYKIVMKADCKGSF